MKRTILVLGPCSMLALLLITLFFLFRVNPQSEPNITTSQDIVDPVALYLQAVNKAYAMEQLSYYAATVQEMQLNHQTFICTSQQRINMEHLNRENFRSHIVSAFQIGDYSFDTVESYENGNGYITLDGSHFTAPLSSGQFLSKHPPVECIDPTRYRQVQALSMGENTAILFFDPLEAEPWAQPDRSVFESASGYALIDEAGDLMECIYTLTYSIGSASVIKTTKVIPVSQFQHSTLEGEYLPVDDLNTPKMLEFACGFLLQAESIQSQTQTEIDCPLFSISRKEKSEIILYGYDKDLYAKNDIQIQQVNQSRDGEITKVQQVETFQNGVYCICVNGASENKPIDAAQMRHYCQNALIEDILLPSHITDFATEETEEAYTLTVQGSIDLANMIYANLTHTLYGEAESSTDPLSAFELQYIFTLDKSSGLLQSFSYDFSVYPSADEEAYTLQCRKTQHYQYTKAAG